MAKRQSPGVLNRLAGKKLVFNGKFGFGIEESLKAMAAAQQGTVKDDLDDKIDYLVLSDMNSGKTLQKKVLSLNKKGGSIQVIDADAFRQLAQPTSDEMLALLRSGDCEAYGKIHRSSWAHLHHQPAKHAYHSEDLKGVKLKTLDLGEVQFEGCNFTGAELDHVQFRSAVDCDFSKAVGEAAHFTGDITGSRFHKAVLKGSHFQGGISRTDFTGATVENCIFTVYGYYGQQNQAAHPGSVFTKAKLKSVRFLGLNLDAPQFGSADLTDTQFPQCTIDSGNFSSAIMRNVVLVGCKLTNANLSGADLTGANLADADLTGANLSGANLKNANLRGAKLDGVDLSKAKNYEPDKATSGSVGPALTELDTVSSQAQRIKISFHLRSADGQGEDANKDIVGLDTSGLKYGWGFQLPAAMAAPRSFSRGKVLTFSDAMLQLANVSGHRRVCFETVEVSSTKSPKGGAELRDLVLRGIAEAYAQEMPPAADLAAATKKRRDAKREEGAADREEREKQKAAAAKQKEKEKKQIAKKVAKAVGKVNDVASFLKALEVRIEKPKIDKATKMLKASSFKLFNDITDQSVSGVVKSQTDPDLVYACRVAEDGQYSCCTQNLNVCGGLRGSICKHLLVLITGLVQAGELDPATIDSWVAKTHDTKPELDKEIMGAIFIKYKGAEAGEVDWRPTETVPEDYYAL